MTSELETSTSELHHLTSELKTSTSELHHLTSELKTLTSELHHLTSELERPSKLLQLHTLEQRSRLLNILKSLRMEGWGAENSNNEAKSALI
ncbi:hypothetical protein ACKFKG_24535 [Phormidesmis sp. 146-35]